MRPNIFKSATKELTQDGFITWFLQWADKSNCDSDPILHEAAKDFVRSLLGVEHDFAIHSVDSHRQWKNIDVWAKVNDTEFIVIEDKTNSKEHSSQLERYKKHTEQYYSRQKLTLHFIYLKTGNESFTTLNNIRNKGYKVFTRKELLNSLNKYIITNQIACDFKDYIDEIEIATNNFQNINVITSSWRAGEGFYMHLQTLIPKETHWEYVSNPTGGFLGFWYNWVGTPNYDLYLQIENYFERGIKLAIRIDSWDQSIVTLRQSLADIKAFMATKGIVVEKPSKLKPGKTSTVAILKDVFATDTFSIEGFVSKLQNIEAALNEFSLSKAVEKSS